MIPKISIYSTFWNIKSNIGFDIEDALSNWAYYADEISISVPKCDKDNSHKIIENLAKIHNYKVSIVRPEFDFSDPFFYGKTENAALQNCTGDLLIQENGDERTRFDKNKVENLYDLLVDSGSMAYFIPTIDLYGSYDRAAKISRKWYWHLRNCYRGAVKFGIKENGRPNYEKTSTDELIDDKGNLMSTISLVDDLSIENIRNYVSNGYPIVYHLGFCNLTNRAERAKFWRQFWVSSTGGDQNNHLTSVEELEKRSTFEHNLPLWQSLKSPPV